MVVILVVIQMYVFDFRISTKEIIVSRGRLRPTSKITRWKGQQKITTRRQPPDLFYRDRGVSMRIKKTKKYIRLVRHEPGRINISRKNIGSSFC